ncbi:MAG TPA: cytochrome c biogenesis protein CcsA [Candidatus Thermoplasmatota archaeon]|nr:cytochrome c biogenesis protein CcsA [Candidatus Thermoplasmatota archaeon]
MAFLAWRGCVKASTVTAIRKGTLWATLGAFPTLFYLVWFVAPDWSFQPDVTAPLTRKVLFFHPASAWTSFAAYLVTFVLGIAYLNERDLKYDRPAQAAAEVGFLMNTIALATGTLWGIQEWAKSGQDSLATVYSEPKVLVVVVMWFVFAAYLLLRRRVDAPERRARLGAVFSILGFITVPLSFLTSRLLTTSLHPDIAGPGKNPDAAVSGDVGLILLGSFLAFLVLFVHLFLQRTRHLALAARLDQLESP